jgi:NNP family nitrate/nitrite transporter-like MFS transporter
MPWIAVLTNTFAFGLCFAAWVVFGPSARLIARELHLQLASIALLKTVPILIGSTTRVPIGMLTDRFGARCMMPAVMTVAGFALLYLNASSSITDLMIGGAFLGLCGSSFAVGVASVSSWTPVKMKGTALGIFGSGNIGTAITTLCLPLLIVAIGWRGSYRVYGFTLLAAAVTYAIVARDAPSREVKPGLSKLLAPLRSGRTWLFGFYYVATFGVFVALTLTLGDIYVDAYGVSLVHAGLLSTIFTFTAGISRIPGGHFADQWGARRVLQLALGVAAISLTPICFGTPMKVTVILGFLGGIALGMGMAAVFRYIPDEFPSNVGAVGGIVGALGGLGGFFLPQLSAIAKARGGSVYLSIAPLAASIVAAMVLQHSSARPVVGAASANGTATNSTTVNATVADATHGSAR